MKYFVNFPYTAETLKNEYRELCKKLHPDTGGNAEEFKNMMNEYEQTARNLSGTKQNAEKKAAEEAERRRREEEARERREWEAEQERQRKAWEAEKKAEEERKAKARPLYEARCKKWAHLMEDLTPYLEAERKAVEAERAAGMNYGYRSAEYKEAGKVSKAARTATHAARRRNLLKMAQHAFKGVKFSLRYDNGWGGGFTIAWTDGPSLEDFIAATDYDLFVNGWDTFDGMTDCAGYERAMFTDFADKYNGLGGQMEYDREISDENRQKMADALKRLNPDFTDPEAKSRYDCPEWEDIAVFMSADKIRDFFRIFGADFDSVTDEQKRTTRVGRHHYRDYMDSRKTLAGWIKSLADFITFKNDDEKKAEKPAEFAPRYGATLRALYKLVGGQNAAFWIYDRKARKSSPLSVLEMVEALERGEAVRYGEKHESKDAEGNKTNTSYWGVNNGGYKVQARRAEKFAAAGYTLNSTGHSDTFADVEIIGINPATAAALRADLADIERQRKAWEESQKAAQNGAKAEKVGNSKAEAKKADSEPETTTSEAPAEGLKLEEIAGGVAVVADDWKTTYRNRHQIKAHGCHWNKEAKRWEATDPADVLKVRAWFLLRGGFGVESDPIKTDEEIKAEAAAEIAHDEQQARAFAEAFAAAADAMHEAVTSEPQSEPTEAQQSEPEAVAEEIPTANDESATEPKQEAQAKPEAETAQDGRNCWAFVLLVSGKVARVMACDWWATRSDAERTAEGMQIAAQGFRDSAHVAVYQRRTDGRYYFAFGKNLGGRDIFPPVAEIDGGAFVALYDPEPTPTDEAPTEATEAPTEGATVADNDSSTTANDESATEGATAATADTYKDPPRERIRFSPDDYQEAA